MRSAGGVLSSVRSRMPVRLISSVRGIGRGREREHVDAGLQLLDLLLVADAEALLLVDHEQARGP